jgi:hypothetical protein
MAENYILLERVELNASAASISFANIPQTGYTDLKIVISGRTDRSGQQDDDIKIQVNGNTSAIYSQRRVLGNGSATFSDSSSGSNVGVSFTTGPTATANTFGSTDIYIPNYAGSTNKSMSVDGVSENNATAAGAGMNAFLASTTSPITSITFAPLFGTVFVANSTFSLYGIAAVGTTPAIAPKASGGNIIDYDGTYWIHTFLTSGTFTPQTGLTCDVLVVAGGGGGGGGSTSYGAGGGGGAGGFRTATNFALSSSTAVTVGAGGPLGVKGTGTHAGKGTNGSDSVLSTISSTGGGAGGGAAANGNQNPNTGGSGGGGAFVAGAAGNAGSYSPVEGFAGGTGSSNSGGGGGGASAVGGAAAFGSPNGTGGAGTSNSYSGSSVGYAGGGGGSSNVGLGGTASDGGGAGGNGTGTLTAGGNGTTNRGGGGGAGANFTGGVSCSDGGNGGSGIVIIRYPAA